MRSTVRHTGDRIDEPGSIAQPRDQGGEAPLQNGNVRLLDDSIFPDKVNSDTLVRDGSHHRFAFVVQVDLDEVGPRANFIMLTQREPAPATRRRIES